MLGGQNYQQDGTNAFIFSRYLVPHLQDYKGWAIFCDGDMHVTADIAELYNLRDESKAVQVVKHNYNTKATRKYIETPIENDNIDYPRKNWSSVILWNCAHPSNALLSSQVVAEAGGAFLHRFQWLEDDEIGALPFAWNWLVGEYEHDDNAKLYHHTLGSPGFKHYSRCDSSWEWNTYLLNALNMAGERPTEIVRRAYWYNNGGNNKLLNTTDSDSGLPDTG